MAEGIGTRHVLYGNNAHHNGFSMLPIDDGVVHSPPNNRKHPNIVNSPTPMKPHPNSVSAWDVGLINSTTPRKLYDDEVDVVASLEVWGCEFVKT